MVDVYRKGIMVNVQLRNIADHLKVKSGIIKPYDNYYMIEIAIEPFFLDEELITTHIVLDFIEFGTMNLDEIQGKTFEFPINPENGYIDGSIYLSHVHNPVETYKIIFGEINGSTIPAALYVGFNFEYENTDFQSFNALIELDLEIISR